MGRNQIDGEYNGWYDHDMSLSSSTEFVDGIMRVGSGKALATDRQR